MVGENAWDNFNFLNLLSFDLWPQMCSILVNVPCKFAKNVYSVKSIWSRLSFMAWVLLLILYLDDLSLDVTGVLKSPIIIVLLPISPFIAVCSCVK